MKCYKFTNSSEKCTKWRYDKTMFDATLRSEVCCPHVKATRNFENFLFFMKSLI